MISGGTTPQRAKIMTRRLSENVHLLRYPHPSSLRRTSMYASFLRISDALHLSIFQQPPMNPVFRQAPRVLWILPALVFISFLLPSPGLASRIVINSEDQYNFALKMMEKGEYLIAVGEFERFIQFFPHDKKIPEANFLIGVCYLKAKDYENARNVLQGTHSKYPDTEVGGKALFWIGESYFRQRAFSEAERYFASVVEHYDLPQLKNGALYRLAWARMHSRKWKEASQTFKKIDKESDLYPSAQELAEKSLSGEDLAYKNPNTAGIMAALLPGLGHAYCRRYRDGLMAFVVNGVFIWASVESFHEGHEVLGGMLTFLELGWYAGNIYSAVNCAHKYNRHKKNEFLKNLPDRLNLHLFTTGSKSMGFALRINF